MDNSIYFYLAESQTELSSYLDIEFTTDNRLERFRVSIVFLRCNPLP